MRGRSYISQPELSPDALGWKNMKLLIKPSTPALALAVLIAGCASKLPSPPPAQAHAQIEAQRRSEFDMSLDKWNGATLAEVLTRLGKPSKVARQPDGNSLYSFTKATAEDPGTGRARFSCTVSYVIDAKTQRVNGHQIAGC